MTVYVDISNDNKHVNITAEWRYKELCKSIPGALWDTKTQQWRVPLSWASCLALRSTFKDDLTLGPNILTWATNERSTRIDPSMAFRDIEHLDGTDNLFPHQRAGVQFLTVARRALLADEPGLGKTAQAIRALAEINSKGEAVFPALVVAPNTVKKTWQREFNTWWPGTKVQVISGSAMQRRKQFAEPADVYVINWESLRAHSRLAPYGSIALARCPAMGGEDPSVSETKCEVTPRELNSIDFKAVIADEIHRSKDPKSKQTRALWAATGDAPIRFALTGTPIANNVLDLWPILHWLSPEEWPSKTRWIDRMINTMINAFGGMMVIGVKAQMEEEFYAAINPRMRRMLKARVLPWLPPVLKDRRDVEMSAKQAKAYKQMREIMIAELEDGTAVTAPSPLTQTTRLLQFASSYAEMTPDKDTGELHVRLTEPSCKIDALMDDIQNNDFGTDSVAVCAVSRQLIDLLSAAMTDAKIEHGLITGAQTADERQSAIDRFQSGEIKWILFTAQAGGVGITLTAARRLIMLQRPWSLVDYKQATDRVHRIGSEIHDNVIITDYVTADSIEERVIEVLDIKAESFDEIVKDKAKLLKLLLEDKSGVPEKETL